MRKSSEISLYHFTHEDLDSFFERVIRYTKNEAMYYETIREALFKISLEIGATICWLIFHKKIWLLGWKGIALGYAFLIYFLTKYLYAWERFSGKGKERYLSLQRKLLREWDQRQPKPGTDRAVSPHTVS